MDLLMTLAAIVFVLLIASFIGYACMTNSIIKDQKREISKVRAENRKLRKLIHDEVKPVQKVIEIHDHRINEENIPTFGDI